MHASASLPKDPPAASRRDSHFHRLGTLLFRRRRLVIAVWLVALATGLPALSQLERRVTEGGFVVPGSQSEIVQRALDSDFGPGWRSSMLLVVHSDRLRAGDSAFEAKVQRLRATLQGSEGVRAVSDPYADPARMVAPDGHTVIALVRGDLPDTRAVEAVRSMQALVAEAPGDPRVSAGLTGRAPFYAAFQDAASSDLQRAERRVLPLALLILLIAFGSVVAAGLPLLTAVGALGVAFACISVLAAATTVNVLALNLATMLGLGVGIDYALLMVTRYRTFLRDGLDVPSAVAEASATSGKAIATSALTVVVALAGTQLVDVPAYRSMGVGAMLAVAVTGAAAVLLLPALLAVAGRGTERWAVRRGRRRRRYRERWAEWAWRHPVITIACSVTLLLGLALPALHLSTAAPDASTLPADAPARAAVEWMRADFGEGRGEPLQVLVRDRRGVVTGGSLEAIGRQLAREPEVRSVAMPGGADLGATVSRDGKSAVIAVFTRHGPHSSEAESLVRRLRTVLPGAAAPASVLVGGEPATNVDLNDEVAGRVPLVVGAVLAVSFVILALFFRAVPLALKAVLLTTTSVLATYGVLVLVFQDGIAAPLGVAATGELESFLPLFLFCIVFGLSMDYAVFLLARVRELHDGGLDTHRALVEAVGDTGGVIASGAAIMCVVFGGFALAEMPSIRTIGLGLAVAVVLDVTVARLALVPAAMRLLGRWNWWFPRARYQTTPAAPLSRDTPSTVKESLDHA